MHRVLVQPRISRIGEYRALAGHEGLQFEIIEFSHANLTHAGLRELQSEYSKSFEEDYQSIASFHGAFMDLIVSSPDAYIAEASRRRVAEGVEMATHFGAEYILFHSNLIPSLATYEGYEDAWVSQNIEYWSTVAEQTSSTILIENMFDTSPDAICRVIDGVSSDRVRACLNVGHWNAFSKASLSNWFEVMGDKECYSRLPPKVQTSNG